MIFFPFAALNIGEHFFLKGNHLDKLAKAMPHVYNIIRQRMEMEKQMAINSCKLKLLTVQYKLFDRVMETALACMWLMLCHTRALETLNPKIDERGENIQMEMILYFQLKVKTFYYFGSNQCFSCPVRIPTGTD